jgi:hypothetical protein
MEMDGEMDDCCSGVSLAADSVELTTLLLLERQTEHLVHRRDGGVRELRVLPSAGAHNARQLTFPMSDCVASLTSLYSCSSLMCRATIASASLGLPLSSTLVSAYENYVS